MKTSELRTKKVAELQELLAVTRQELADARRGLAAGELTNPRVIGEKRKLIARIMTVSRETNETNNEEKA